MFEWARVAVNAQSHDRFAKMMFFAGTGNKYLYKGKRKSGANVNGAAFVRFLQVSQAAVPNPNCICV